VLKVVCASCELKELLPGLNPCDAVICTQMEKCFKMVFERIF